MSLEVELRFTERTYGLLSLLETLDGPDGELHLFAYTLRLIAVPDSPAKSGQQIYGSMDPWLNGSPDQRTKDQQEVGRYSQTKKERL